MVTASTAGGIILTRTNLINAWMAAGACAAIVLYPLTSALAETTAAPKKAQHREAKPRSAPSKPSAQSAAAPAPAPAAAPAPAQVPEAAPSLPAPALVTLKPAQPEWTKVCGP